MKNVLSNLYAAAVAAAAADVTPLYQLILLSIKSLQRSVSQRGI